MDFSAVIDFLVEIPLLRVDDDIDRRIADDVQREQRHLDGAVDRHDEGKADQRGRVG